MLRIVAHFGSKCLKCMKEQQNAQVAHCCSLLRIVAHQLFQALRGKNFASKTSLRARTSFSFRSQRYKVKKKSMLRFRYSFVNKHTVLPIG